LISWDNGTSLRPAVRFSCRAPCPARRALGPWQSLLRRAEKTRGWTADRCAGDPTSAPSVGTRNPAIPRGSPSNSRDAPFPNRPSASSVPWYPPSILPELVRLVTVWLPGPRDPESGLAGTIKAACEGAVLGD